MDLINKVTCNHVVGTPKVTYILSTCPRCRGTGFYGGLGIGNDGRVSLTSQGPALSQEIEKILTEGRRESGYGFDYTVLSGVIDAGKLQAVRSEITRCLSYLKASQDREERLGFNYAKREKLLKIISLEVKQDSTDPRQINASVVVLSDSQNQVGVVFSLRR